MISAKTVINCFLLPICNIWNKRMLFIIDFYAQVIDFLFFREFRVTATELSDQNFDEFFFSFIIY